MGRVGREVRVRVWGRVGRKNKEERGRSLEWKGGEEMVKGSRKIERKIKGEGLKGCGGGLERGVSKEVEKGGERVESE